MNTGIGTILSEARRARGLELADVHEVTKIRVALLEAIEDERWEAMPGKAYARGFVTTYAEFLGLDPEPLIAKLDAPGSPAPHLSEPIIETGQLPGSRRHVRGWAALVAVVLAIIVLAAIASGGDEPGSDEPREADSPAVSEETTPDEDSSRAEPEPTKTEEAPSDVSLVLRATGAVWVCLVDQRDRRLVSAETLAEGDRRGPFEGQRFLLTLGNGQVRLLANGERLAVAESSDPLGYRVGPAGLKDLAEAERPDCS